MGWEDPLEEGMATTPVFLPGESHGQRSLVGCSPGGHKESDTTERLTTLATEQQQQKIFNKLIICIALLNTKECHKIFI